MTMPSGNRPSNITRFEGFGDVYQRYRPEAPPHAAALILRYLGRRPELVLDLGSGTGLSSFVWLGRADRIVGIEPGADMRAQAEARLSGDSGAAASLSFAHGYSNRLAFDDDSADVVTCSQSFHWMEPQSTLREAARVLRTGGVFAAYDCDWPPAAGAEVERAYMALTRKADQVGEALSTPDARAIKADKEGHLEQLRRSGVFRYVRELVFHHAEPADAERYVGLAMSQGGVQAALRLDRDALEPELAALRAAARTRFGDGEEPVEFGYRMRLGVV
ncbi:class I SAM-dependent methyltransferase [Paenibacillus sp. IB182496]|uniref:Class I SAM-dependent methyltransferase n=1 Tax=Paenibacillus sabuli TaxID=2772509 RepID=A0A927BV24_9BACL|nr:class I SAM-dependent methyltransferase [Paenibacillus sabuli]MBD2846862.1 class I SAM-dependent methyltransferase [Paenibacillus sabuli]